jgi:hypothetical protein
MKAYILFPTEMEGRDLVSDTFLTAPVLADFVEYARDQLRRDLQAAFYKLFKKRCLIRFSDECSKCGWAKEYREEAGDRGRSEYGGFCTNPACPKGFPPMNVLRRIWAGNPSPKDETVEQWHNRMVALWRAEVAAEKKGGEK